MLDPDEWTVAIGVAVVNRRSGYAAAEPAKLVSEDGLFLRIGTHVINGRVPGGLEPALAAGAMEERARAMLDGVFESAEQISRHDRELGLTAIAGGGRRGLVAIAADIVNSEPTLQEIWGD